MRNPPLFLLWLVHPEEALRQCQTAMRLADGNRRIAAITLGVSERTLYRWIDKHPEIDQWRLSSQTQ